MKPPENDTTSRADAATLLQSLHSISVHRQPGNLSESLAAAQAYEQGRQIGIAGGSQPEGLQAAQGWLHGDTKRRIASGEVLGFVCQGTRCTCGEQNWGWRGGCRCDDPAQTLEWGLLIDDGLADDQHAKFMTTDQVRATGLPLVHCFTGEVVETSPPAAAETA